ncbi:MAG: type IV pilin [Halanaeroarchaeum sp.]
MDDSRAVSPVIGVILMVAITVILAAVIGTFVLGLGQQVSSTAPQATLSMTPDAPTDNITVSHNGGSAIAANSITIQVRNETSGNVLKFNPDANSANELTVGDTLIINTSVDTKVVWPDGSTLDAVNSYNNSIDLQSGHVYTVQIIHEPSQQMIANRKLRP